MSSDSKIRFFFILAVFTVGITSCNKKNDVIPDVSVYFIIKLTDVQFSNLTLYGGSVAVDSRTNNWGSATAGDDGNGIIICAGLDEFYAYDRTCPHD